LAEQYSQGDIGSGMRGIGSCIHSLSSYDVIIEAVGELNSDSDRFTELIAQRHRDGIPSLHTAYTAGIANQIFH